jgi:hypothetical protein
LNQNLKTLFLFFLVTQNQFGPVPLTAHLLTFLFFFIFHHKAHNSAQSIRPFGPAQPTTPSFLSRPESLAPVQLAYRPAQPTRPIFPARLPPLAVSNRAAAALQFAPPRHVTMTAALLHLGEVEPKRWVIPFKFTIKTMPPRLLFPLNSFKINGD